MPSFLSGIQKKIGTQALELAGYIGSDINEEAMYRNIDKRSEEEITAELKIGNIHEVKRKSDGKLEFRGNVI